MVCNSFIQLILSTTIPLLIINFATVPFDHNSYRSKSLIDEDNRLYHTDSVPEAGSQSVLKWHYL